MLVDYHVHSLCSDGVYTVKEVVEMLLRRQVSFFALTDHDTVEGIAEARKLSRNKINFVSGIEFTCREMQIVPMDKWYSIHLLGYDFDENNVQLLGALHERKEKVISIFENLCKELTAAGYSVSIDKIPISCGNVLQLCDVAAYIAETYPNVPEDIFKSIENYTEKLKNVNISAEDAVRYIHNAGGRAVWAHPFCVYQDLKKINIDENEVLDILNILAEIGVDGIEAQYLAFGEEKRTWLRTVAENRDMIYTAGSDFHGSVGRDFMGMEARCVPQWHEIDKNGHT